MATTTTTQMTVKSLTEAGFSADQIDRLKKLREKRFCEFTETHQQYERLAFLKWRYENGDIERG